MDDGGCDAHRVETVNQLTCEEELDRDRLVKLAASPGRVVCVGDDPVKAGFPPSAGVLGMTDMINDNDADSSGGTLRPQTSSSVVPRGNRAQQCEGQRGRRVDGRAARSYDKASLIALARRRMRSFGRWMNGTASLTVRADLALSTRGMMCEQQRCRVGRPK